MYLDLWILRHLYWKKKINSNKEHHCFTMWSVGIVKVISFKSLTFTFYKTCRNWFPVFIFFFFFLHQKNQMTAGSLRNNQSKRRKLEERHKDTKVMRQHMQSWGCTEFHTSWVTCFLIPSNPPCCESHPSVYIPLGISRQSTVTLHVTWRDTSFVFLCMLIAN